MYEDDVEIKIENEAAVYIVFYRNNECKTCIDIYAEFFTSV